MNLNSYIPLGSTGLPKILYSSSKTSQLFFVFRLASFSPFGFFSSYS